MARIKGIDKAIDLIRRGIADQLNNEKMQLLGDVAVELIRTRTRLGFGVDDIGGTRRVLRPLSNPYIEYRQANPSLLSALTRPTKSNLTFTGQMLDSLDVVKARNGKVTISPTGRRNDGYTNLQIGEYVTQQGRAFNNLSRNELKQLARVAERGLSKALERRLNRT